MTPTYLSIDLDYWCVYPDDLPQIDCDRLFRRVLALSVPVVLVTEHHALLRDPHLVRARRLVNLDFHDDLAEFDGHPPVCGTWVSHVPWRVAGEYVWMPPYTSASWQEYGRCSGAFEYIGCQPSIATAWGRVRKSVTYRIPWCEITAIGVALSPHWCRASLAPVERVLRGIGEWEWAKTEVAKSHRRGDVMAGTAPGRFRLRRPLDATAI